MNYLDTEEIKAINFENRIALHELSIHRHIEEKHGCYAGIDYPICPDTFSEEGNAKLRYFTDQFSAQMFSFMNEALMVRDNHLFSSSSIWINRLMTILDVSTQNNRWINPVFSVPRHAYRMLPHIDLRRRIDDFKDEFLSNLIKEVAQEITKCYRHQLLRLTMQGPHNGIDTFVIFLQKKLQRYLTTTNTWNWLSRIFWGSSPTQDWSAKARLVFCLLTLGGENYRLKTEQPAPHTTPEIDLQWTTLEMEKSVGICELHVNPYGLNEPIQWTASFYKRFHVDEKLVKKYGFRYPACRDLTKDPTCFPNQQSLQLLTIPSLDEIVEENRRHLLHLLNDANERIIQQYEELKIGIERRAEIRTKIESVMQHHCRHAPKAPSSFVERKKQIDQFRDIFCNKLFSKFLTAKFSLEHRIRKHGTISDALVVFGVLARPLNQTPGNGTAGTIGRAVGFVFGAGGEVAAAYQNGGEILTTRVQGFLRANMYTIAREVCEPIIMTYYHQLLRMSSQGSEIHGTKNGLETFADYLTDKVKAYFDQTNLRAWIENFFGLDEQGEISHARRLCNLMLQIGSGQKMHLPTSDPRINQKNRVNALDSPWNTVQLEISVGLYDSQNDEFYCVKNAHLKTLYQKYGFRPAFGTLTNAPVQSTEIHRRRNALEKIT